MKKQLTFIWLIIAGVIIAALGIILLMRSRPESNLPENSMMLDQLNIQTQDPQPAGKNITR